jgi:NAD(P) transhydrogenase subunit alpha
MHIGVPRETSAGETRVALVPDAIRALRRDGHEIHVEAGAGVASFVSDTAYVEAGATIVADARVLYQQADAILKVQPPTLHPSTHQAEAEMVREGTIYFGFLEPWARGDVMQSFAHRRITAYAMELVPRVARAQSMDAMTSMATLAGYKAVLLATEHLAKMFPLLMTAAGTIPPANVLVLGAGVAGLQAIATARRLGARVEAFDPRPAVQEQARSLGATFLDMPLPEDVETAGGYAREQSAVFLRQEQETIGRRLPVMEVVICTAQVFGKRAPVLITADMLALLKPGAVVVDLAAEQGGNCEATRQNEVVEVHGVTVIGAVNLPATLPVDASQLYAHNVVALFQYLYPAAGAPPGNADEIERAVCVTRDGEVVNELARAALQAASVGVAPAQPAG